MPRFRVSVDYGDDRIRTYAVDANEPGEAVSATLNYVVNMMLTVDAADDWEDWEDLEPDDTFGVVDGKLTPWDEQ